MISYDEVTSETDHDEILMDHDNNINGYDLGVFVTPFNPVVDFVLDDTDTNVSHISMDEVEKAHSEEEK